MRQINGIFSYLPTRSGTAQHPSLWARSSCSDIRYGPARIVRAGRRAGRSVAVAAIGAGPDEAEAFVLVFEEVGVDRSGEARIVQLEAKIVATLVRGLRPGGADLGAADQDAVAGSVLAGLAGFGNDADVFGLHVEGDDFSGVFIAGLLEGADGGHGISPFSLFSSPHHCGLDGDREAGGDRRFTRRAET